MLKQYETQISYSVLYINNKMEFCGINWSTVKHAMNCMGCKWSEVRILSPRPFDILFFLNMIGAE